MYKIIIRTRRRRVGGEWRKCGLDPGPDARPARVAGPARSRARTRTASRTRTMRATGPAPPGLTRLPAPVAGQPVRGTQPGRPPRPREDASRDARASVTRTSFIFSLIKLL